MRQCARPGRRRVSESSSPHLLHEFKPCEAEHQPFRTELLEVDVDARVRPLPLDVEHDTFAELAVPHAGAEAHAAVAGFRIDAAAARAAFRHTERPRELDARAQLLEQLRRYLLDEARGHVVAVDAMQAALLGVAEVERAHGAGDPDVTEPPLLLEAGQIIAGALVRKEPVLQTSQEHHRKFQSLGAVQGHHLQAVFPLAPLGLARFEHGMRQETLQRRQLAALRLVAARGAHQLLEVLDARLAALGLVLAMMLDEAAVADDVIDLFMQRQALDLAAETLDERLELLQRG